MSHYLEGIDTVGATAIINLDEVVASYKNALASWKPTYAQARSMVEQALVVNKEMISLVSSASSPLVPIDTSKWPTVAILEEVRGHLEWHKKKIEGDLAAGPPLSLYPSGDDLKKWILSNFTRAAVTVVSIVNQQTTSSDAAEEIKASLVKQAEGAAKAVQKAGGGIAKTIEYLPYIIGGAVLLVGTLLTVIVVKHGGTVARVAARRYLP